MPAERTHPFDVALALRLTSPAGTLGHIADELGVAPSQVHASIRRLDFAGLLKPGTREANPRALGEFVLFGVRYAFPAVRGPLTEGIPTASSAEPLASEIDALDVLVWPARTSADTVRGFGIAPLYRQALELPVRSLATYRLLTLVDALRVADARARNAARAHIEQALGWRAP